MNYSTHSASAFRNLTIALFLLCGILTVSAIRLDAQSAELNSLLASMQNVVLLQQQGYGAVADPAQPSKSPIVRSVDVDVEIDGEMSTTTLTAYVMSIQRPNDDAMKSSPESFHLLFPLPDDAKLIEAPTIGNRSGGLTSLDLSRDEAMNAVTRIAVDFDAAGIMEFAGSRMILAGPYTLHHGAEQKIRLVYSERLERHGNRLDYRLPRSESFDYQRTAWKINVNVKSTKPIAALYSPGHPLAINRKSPTEQSATVQPPAIGSSRLSTQNRPIDPGDFRLSVMTGNEVSASFLAYAEPGSEQGCMLMLIGAPQIERSQEMVIRREVTLVIDRSGSMNGTKIEQVKEASRNILRDLADGESFNIIQYSDLVTSFSPTPTIKDDASLQKGLEYIDGISSGGGTNIHDALVSAVSADVTPDFLPLVIFLTDGQASTGITDEAGIRTGVVNANVHNRRIFTFGVGFDVNAPLLEAIATDSRASTTLVAPNESVEEGVRALFSKLKGPVFSDITLSVETRSGADASHLITDMLPARLNDLFEGDYLSLLGHFQPNESVIFVLAGNYLGAKREFRFRFDPKDDQVQDAPFLCRLWSSRRIMENVEQISRDGAVPENERTEEDRERLRQQTEEIIDLSMNNGIITEYTRDLAMDTLTISVDDIAALTEAKLKSRAQDVRYGAGASNQVMNKKSDAIKGGLANVSNGYVDENMNVVQIRTVQQISNMNFFRRGDRWVETAALDSARTESPDATITIGTPEYTALLQDLVARNQQELLGLRGEILLRRDDELVLIRNGATLE